MSHNATLCKEAWEKKLPAQVTQCTCYCYGFGQALCLMAACILHIQQSVLSQQAKCLMCVGTITVTVIFLGALGKEWILW